MSVTLFAVFVEAEATEDGYPQYVVFPTGHEKSIILGRVSNGGKRGLNEWRLTNALPGGHVLTRDPSAIIVTDADIQQWREDGVPSNALDRAIAAHKRAPSPAMPEDRMTTDDLGTLVSRVQQADIGLNEWVRDGRRTHPVEPVGVGAPADDVTRRPAVVMVPNRPATNRMAYIPDLSVAKAYVHRTVWGVPDFDLFDWCMANGKNALLYGPTGAGKTMSPEAYAAERGLHMAMVSGNVAMTPHQILGGLIGDGKGGWIWQDGIATEIVRNGGVLDLDELNFIPSKVATVLFPLLAGQRHITLLDNGGETIKAHPDLLIVATMNPGYSGTIELNAALRNRFTIQVPWGYDDYVERTLIPADSLRLLASKLRVAEANDEISTPTPTNALMDFAMLAEGLGYEFASNNFLARYGDDEVASVRLALDAMTDDIRADLGIDPPVADPDTDEVVEGFDALQALANVKI